jgi:predicted nucleotidyltransferase
MILKPQDILFLLKLVAIGKKPWSFNQLALELGMSASEVHAAAQRAVTANLALREGGKILPQLQNLEEFLLHGLQYVFVPERGAVTYGMPTGHAGLPIKSEFESGQGLPPVWPFSEGSVLGESFTPLYKSVPIAARNDAVLYELLVLVDAIRGGCTNERNWASKELHARIFPESHCEELRMDKTDSIVIGDSFVVSRRALKELAVRFHIKRLVLFGSAARGELSPGSDIDLLVEFEEGHGPSLGGMVNIRDALVDVFGGRQVDLATPTILRNPYRKKEIEKDMEELYAA